MKQNKVYQQIFISFMIVFNSFFLIQCVHKNEIKNSENNSTDQIIDRFPAGSTVKKSNIKFESCVNKKKNYLVPYYSQFPFDYFKDHSNDWIKKIPMECIQLAQKNYSGSFAFCESENSKPKVGAPRPCLDENYLQLIYNAFHDVNDCFNLDPRSSFLQIMIESGFHLNAINRTGFDAGLTQFTKNGLSRVYKGDLLRRTEQLLLESSNPSCARVSSTFRSLKLESFNVTNRCSMIAMPNNPYRAFILHYLHGMRDKIDLKKLLEKRSEIVNILDDEILEQLVFLAYNRGITGTLKLIDNYISNRKSAHAQITREDLDLWKNLSTIRKILKKNPEKLEVLKNARIKQLTFAEYAMIQNKTYLSTMSEAGDLVKARLGDACF